MEITIKPESISIEIIFSKAYLEEMGLDHTFKALEIVLKSYCKENSINTINPPFYFTEEVQTKLKLKIMEKLKTIDFEFKTNLHQLNENLASKFDKKIRKLAEDYYNKHHDSHINIDDYYASFDYGWDNYVLLKTYEEILNEIKKTGTYKEESRFKKWLRTWLLPYRFTAEQYYNKKASFEFQKQNIYTENQIIKCHLELRESFNAELMESLAKVKDLLKKLDLIK